MNPKIGFKELQRRITTLAKNRGIPETRLYQRIATEVLFNILELAHGDALIDRYAVKGGMALEVRFGMRARASRDVDVSIPVPFDAIRAVLDRIFTLRFSDFQLRRRGPLRMLDRVQAYRTEIEVRYAGKMLYRLDLDVNSSDFEPSVDVVPSGVLTELGLPGPVNVALLDVSAQLAHKIHGATQPSLNGYRNERFRDVLDALIIEEGSELDLEWVRIVCGAEFSRRATHGWPPRLLLDERWQNGLRAEALANGYSIRDPQELARAFNALVERIEGTMHEVTSTKIIKMLPEHFTQLADRPVGDQSNEVTRLLGDGWVIAQISRDPHRTDRELVVVMEQRRVALRAPRELPRLQARLEMRYPGPNMPDVTEVTPLSGVLRNVGAPANMVRMILPGVQQDYSTKSKTRFGTIVEGDAIDIAFPPNELQNVGPSGGPWEIAFEYEDDAGQKFRQSGPYEAFASYNNVRIFQVLGLGGPRPIESYSAKYAP